MSFRGSVRRALAAPLGGPPARHFAIPAVTAIVTAADFGEPERIALAELAEAMVRAGVPRGRTFVILAGGGPGGPARREAVRGLRDTLGVPVMAHDPARAGFVPGALAIGVPLELDDELREAEAVVVCGRVEADPRGGVRGGPALLLPGLAGAATAAAYAAALPAGGDAAGRARAAWEASSAVLEHVPVDFALAWSGADPPAVLAGDGRAVFEACLGAGWLAPRGAAGARGPGGAA